MNTKQRFALTLACFLLAGFLARPTEAQFEKLLKHVPHTANTLILFNAEKVLNSEIALREGWRTNFDRAIEKGLTHLPADSLQYVMASETDFEYMHPEWEVGLLSTKDKHDMVYIASKRNGKQDTVAGLQAVLMPTGHYLIQLDPTTYGTLVPGSRQAVSRWIKETAKGKSAFSPYLREAIGYEEMGTEIIMAMDLTDVLDLETVRGLVKENKVIADAGVDVEAAVKVLASLRGVMLGITFGAKSYGSIKVDFGEDASILDGIAGDLLTNALAKHGATIDDFTKWKSEFKGKQIRFSGGFSADGLRKILSLMEPPTHDAVVAQDQDPQSAGGQDSVVVSTQKYFAAVNSYVRDLRNKEPQRIAQYGIWYDKYARKIDRLPMINVDNDMLDFGAYVSQQFRNAGAAIQGIGVRSRVRQVGADNALASGGGGIYGVGYGVDGGYAYGGYTYRGVGGWGRGNAQQANLRSQQRAGTQIRVQEKAAGTSAARAIMADLDRASADIRRQMTQKYNVQFTDYPDRKTSS